MKETIIQLLKMFISIIASGTSIYLIIFLIKIEQWIWFSLLIVPTACISLFTFIVIMVFISEIVAE